MEERPAQFNLFFKEKRLFKRLTRQKKREASKKANTVEPPNNGHGGDEHFVHCSEVVPSSEVLPLSSIIIIISLVCESQCIYIGCCIIYIYIQCI